MESSPALADLFAPAELPVAEVINPHGKSPVLLICEHASAAIPAALDNLGLPRENRLSHAAWDIGALDLCLALSTALDAPLVVSRVSRLVYDCNRPPSSPGAIPTKSELIEVPGNSDLSSAQKSQRAREVYEPFQHLLSQTIAARSQPVLVTIHSFTPRYFGQPRATELGILHDTDDQLAQTMLGLAPETITMQAEMNAPYAASDGVTHTLREHGIKNALQNVMLEIRNDLIDHPAGLQRVTHDLAALITRSLAPHETECRA